MLYTYKFKCSGMDFKRVLNSNSLEKQRQISLSAVQTLYKSVSYDNTHQAI